MLVLFLKEYPSGLEVLTAMAMKCAVFWDVMPCSSVETHRRFGGTYFHFQDR
jgi:hypothetical protein